jgi:hypothetical protein
VSERCVSERERMDLILHDTFCKQFQAQALESIDHSSHSCKLNEGDNPWLAIFPLHCNALIVE